MPKGRQEHFDSYRGLHQPSGDPGDPAIHNMETLFPDDVYTHPHFYGHGDKVVDREAGRALQGAKGDPEAMVDIYRGVPHGVSSINQGDWVTTSPTYARQHGFHGHDPTKDWPVLHAQVPARHVSTGGNDIVEWGYSGPTIENAAVHHPGGRS